jgi:hypothetical protein
MVSQSVSLGIEPHLGPMTRYLFLSDSYVLVSMGRPLWREHGSVFVMCRWSLPAQSFSGPSPLGLATVFYCLIFKTSLFVASYDSQGHGGGIRPRLHTGWSTHRNHSPSFVAWRRPHRKHVSHVRLQVDWSVSSTGCGADDIENTASSIVACWTVFTELLPGNSLTKSVTIRTENKIQMTMIIFWNPWPEVS